MDLFRKKSLTKIIKSASDNSLKKTLGVFDLILLGIGCVIGTGIFVLTGIGATVAGPAISASYFLAAVVCMLTALSYAELASSVPVSGSAYTYSYITLGEFFAWLVGWGLFLEYTVGAATVASGWSGYVLGILKSGGIYLPDVISKVPSEGGKVNLLAIIITLFVGFLLVRGTKESIVLNRILVAIKILVIFLFILIALPHYNSGNLVNFSPFGFNGIILGAATVFFAYIGFDSVATAAEECKNPKKDLPIAIIASLTICGILYVLVAFVLTSIANYKDLGNAEPLAYALRINGNNLGSALVAVGAITGMTSVLLVMMYAQSRISFAMARDGLLPKFFNKVHPRFSTPYRGLIFVTIAVAFMSGFTPIKTLGHITSIGTLFAFMIVSIGVIILRVRNPELPRSFKCPMIFVIAPISVVSCGYLMWTLLIESGRSFLLWSIAGLILYFTYSYHNSPLNKTK